MKRGAITFIFLASILIAACGRGGGNDSSGQSSYLLGGSIQGTQLELTDTVNTIAGSPFNIGALDGMGNTSMFNSPRAVTTDGSYLFIADTNNHTIRRLDIQTTYTDTIAGWPLDSGYLDAVGSSARFARPRGITTDGYNLYISDTNNHVIRKVDLSTMEVSTLAGMPFSAGNVDGVGSTALFDTPWHLTTDGTYLYIADLNNHKIRKLDLATRMVTTLAGTGSPGSRVGICDDPINPAEFTNPTGITTDGSYLYVSDGGNHNIKRINLTGSCSVELVAGSSSQPGTAGSSDGIGNNAAFFNPDGLTTDGSRLYISDTSNYTIRQMELDTFEVTTIAGLAGDPDVLDGIGASARFYYPRGITTDGLFLYITDSGGHVIRRIE